MSEIVHLVSQANARAREMSRGLVPVVLESEGLMSALGELASGTEKIFRVSCRFWCDKPVLVRDNKTAVQLYRIAQEAMGNAIKHSHADRIELSLSAAERTDHPAHPRQRCRHPRSLPRAQAPAWACSP